MRGGTESAELQEDGYSEGEENEVGVEKEEEEMRGETGILRLLANLTVSEWTLWRRPDVQELKRALPLPGGLPSSSI